MSHEFSILTEIGDLYKNSLFFHKVAAIWEHAHIFYHISHQASFRISAICNSEFSLSSVAYSACYLHCESHLGYDRGVFPTS